MCKKRVANSDPGPVFLANMNTYGTVPSFEMPEYCYERNRKMQYIFSKAFMKDFKHMEKAYGYPERISSC
jgi:hypothetical protein